MKIAIGGTENAGAVNLALTILGSTGLDTFEIDASETTTQGDLTTMLRSISRLGNDRTALLIKNFERVPCAIRQMILIGDDSVRVPCALIVATVTTHVKFIPMRYAFDETVVIGELSRTNYVNLAERVLPPHAASILGAVADAAFEIHVEHDILEAYLRARARKSTNTQTTIVDGISHLPRCFSVIDPAAAENEATFKVTVTTTKTTDQTRPQDASKTNDKGETDEDAADASDASNDGEDEDEEEQEDDENDEDHPECGDGDGDDDDDDSDGDAEEDQIRDAEWNTMVKFFWFAVPIFVNLAVLGLVASKL